MQNMMVPFWQTLTSKSSTAFKFSWGSPKRIPKCSNILEKNKGSQHGSVKGVNGYSC